jgi:Ca2+-binding EF-hand superfamily protein
MLDKIPLWEITKVARGDRELEEMFLELDVNQDGHITKEEMEVRRPP